MFIIWLIEGLFEKYKFTKISVRYKLNKFVNIKALQDKFIICMYKW